MDRLQAQLKLASAYLDYVRVLKDIFHLAAQWQDGNRFGLNGFYPDTPQEIRNLLQIALDDEAILNAHTG